MQQLHSRKNVTQGYFFCTKGLHNIRVKLDGCCIMAATFSLQQRTFLLHKLQLSRSSKLLQVLGNHPELHTTSASNKTSCVTGVYSDKNLNCFLFFLKSFPYFLNGLCMYCGRNSWKNATNWSKLILKIFVKGILVGKFSKSFKKFQVWIFTSVSSWSAPVNTEHLKRWIHDNIRSRSC